MQNLTDKIKEAAFPCIMAKAVMNQGVCHNVQLSSNQVPELAQAMFNELSGFVDSYRANKERLHSCILSFPHDEFQSFEKFESTFWSLLSELRSIDGQHHPYDSRVSSNPDDGNFSFSVKEEAFFILLLHPNSPRKARQFPVPSIVFNPHQQFEDLRAKGTFERVRTTIRQRDERYQGSVNPMLMDFGSEVSEIYQYTGLDYTEKKAPAAAAGKCPFHKAAGAA